MMRDAMLIALLGFSIGGCADRSATDEQNAFETYVAKHQIGQSVDQWIETKSVVTGQWDRTALVFGYINDDLSECQKALSGFKQANPAREYRCAPAQILPK
ncbi:hypothetical protein [Sphingomonas parapaucimobilis]|nr:hypothetical protein [Sphingomonas parapaucimobilis]